MIQGNRLDWDRIQMHTSQGPVLVFVSAAKERQQLLDFVDAEGLHTVQGEIWMNQRIRASRAQWDDEHKRWTTVFTDPMPDFIPLWELNVTFDDERDALQFQLKHLDF